MDTQWYSIRQGASRGLSPASQGKSREQKQPRWWCQEGRSAGELSQTLQRFPHPQKTKPQVRCLHLPTWERRVCICGGGQALFSTVYFSCVIQEPIASISEEVVGDTQPHSRAQPEAAPDNLTPLPSGATLIPNNCCCPLNAKVVTALLGAREQTRAVGNTWVVMAPGAGSGMLCYSLLTFLLQKGSSSSLRGNRGLEQSPDASPLRPQPADCP